MAAFFVVQYFLAFQGGSKCNICNTIFHSSLPRRQKGFLRWLVEGAVAWYATKDLKRNAPAKVKEVSRKYFEDQDRVSSFVRDRCEIGEGLLVPTTALYDALLEWCKNNNKPAVAADALAKSLKEKGIEKKKARYRGYVTSAQCFVGMSNRELAGACRVQDYHYVLHRLGTCV